jgi:small subunit ribosomal protein S21
MANQVINAEVVARPKENPERLIRRFTKKVKRSGILDEVRQRRYFEKKSVKKRRKKAEAEYRRQRDERRAAKRAESKNKKRRK